MSNIINGTTLVEKESRSIGDVPIGGIISWAKTLSGVPNLAEGWVECDGSVLTDSQSSLNGQTIPDLNGGIFLRGDTTSGGTGGSDTMAHTHTVYRSSLQCLQTGEESYELVNNNTTTAASNTENRPPFYNVVWIMRIK